MTDAGPRFLAAVQKVFGPGVRLMTDAQNKTIAKRYVRVYAVPERRMPTSLEDSRGGRTRRKET